MDLSTATPAEIDTQLAGLYDAERILEGKERAAMAGLHRALGERVEVTGRGASRREAWPTSDAEALAAMRDKGDALIGMMRTAASIVTAYDEAATALAGARDAMRPLTAEYTRRGGWTRFFEVAGGHIHRDQHCSTLHRGKERTQLGWLIEMSGTDEAAAIAELAAGAHILCSVCIPNAPVVSAPPAPRKTAAEKAADREAAERKARLEEPKLIADTDGEPLRVDGATIRTVRSAEIAAVDGLWWAAYGRHTGEPNEPYAVQHEGHTRKIVAALAVKNGTTPAAELARITDKAIKKVRKDLGAEVATAAAAVWAEQAEAARGPVHERIDPTAEVICGEPDAQRLTVIRGDVTCAACLGGGEAAPLAEQPQPQHAGADDAEDQGDADQDLAGEPELVDAEGNGWHLEDENALEPLYRAAEGHQGPALPLPLVAEMVGPMSAPQHAEDQGATAGRVTVQQGDEPARTGQAYLAPDGLTLVRLAVGSSASLAVSAVRSALVAVGQIVRGLDDRQLAELGRRIGAARPVRFAGQLHPFLAARLIGAECITSDGPAHPGFTSADAAYAALAAEMVAEAEDPQGYLAAQLGAMDDQAAADAEAAAGYPGLDAAVAAVAADLGADEAEGCYPGTAAVMGAVAAELGGAPAPRALPFTGFTSAHAVRIQLADIGQMTRALTDAEIATLGRQLAATPPAGGPAGTSSVPYLATRLITRAGECRHTGDTDPACEAHPGFPTADAALGALVWAIESQRQRDEADDAFSVDRFLARGLAGLIPAGAEDQGADDHVAEVLAIADAAPTVTITDPAGLLALVREYAEATARAALRRAGREAETVWCEAHDGAHFDGPGCIWPHYTDAQTRAAMNQADADPAGTLAQIARALGVEQDGPAASVPAPRDGGAPAAS